MENKLLAYCLKGLLDFLLQSIKLRCGEKFPQGDFQSVTELFNRGDGDVLPPGVHHTVYRGGRDP